MTKTSVEMKTEMESHDLPRLFRCPACGSNSSRCTKVSFHSPRGDEFLCRCLRCRSVFAPETYDQEKEVLHAQSQPYGKPESGKAVNDLKREMYHSIVTLLNRHRPPPARLLDVGCSFGGFLIEARNAGYQVSGIDILPEAVAFICSKGISGEVSSSIGDVKTIENGSVDILTCLDINYYWADQPAELKNAFIKLRGGGLLVIRVASKSWLLSIGLLIHRVAPRLAKQIIRRAIHDHRFSMPIRSLQNVIEASGFELVHLSSRRAIPSFETALTVRLLYLLGSILWRSMGVFVAPGALIVAKKPVH